MARGRRGEEFLAKDVYSHWKKLLTSAESSVAIFTPYFDRTLVRLLALSTLPSSDQAVITDLRPQGDMLDCMSQLRATAALLDLGVDVRTLTPLHAKVLLVDESHFTVGSQNFTSNGRRSRETTAVPLADYRGSSFINRLLDWKSTASPVDPLLIEQLLRDLRKPARDLRRAAEALDSAYLAAVDAAQLAMTMRDLDELLSLDLDLNPFELEDLPASERHPFWTSSEEARLLPGQLAGLLDDPSIQSSQQPTRPVYAKLQRPDPSSDYETLKVWRDGDLTRWSLPGRQPMAARVRMYPILLTDTGRMGFARIGKSRITYIRDTLVWGSSMSVNGWWVEVRVSFPSRDTLSSNVTALFTPRNSPVLPAKVSLLFDGRTMVALKAEADTDDDYPIDPRRQEEFNQACADYLTSDEGRTEFLQRFFSRFSYKYLGRDDHNAAEFFGRGYYRLGWIEYNSTPILVASEHR